MEINCPTVCRWVANLDDLSGLDIYEGWGDQLSPLAADLIDHIGSSNIPFLLANEAAIQSGLDWVELVINGNRCNQAPLKDHLTCVNELLAKLTSLSDGARSSMLALFEDARCPSIL